MIILERKVNLSLVTGIKVAGFLLLRIRMRSNRLILSVKVMSTLFMRSLEVESCYLRTSGVAQHGQKPYKINGNDIPVTID